VEILLANSQQVKGQRGHKTDPSDAHWLAHLLRHGLIRASYIPPAADPAVAGLDAAAQTAGAQRSAGALICLHLPAKSCLFRKLCNRLGHLVAAPPR
jgi:hypothetical protein